MTPGVRGRAAILFVVGLVSCAPHPTAEALRAQFDEAERLCLDGEFEQAKSLLKNYLLYDPESAGAHYYLARAYMLSKDFRPTMAEGEYQTALRLFVRQGRNSPIDRFAPDYFEMICYVDSAKVIYVQTANLLSMGISPQTLRPELKRAIAYLDKAHDAMPGAPEVDQVGDPIRDLAARL